MPSQDSSYETSSDTRWRVPRGPTRTPLPSSLGVTPKRGDPRDPVRTSLCSRSEVTPTRGVTRSPTGHLFLRDQESHYVGGPTRTLLHLRPVVTLHGSPQRPRTHLRSRQTVTPKGGRFPGVQSGLLFRRVRNDTTSEITRGPGLIFLPDQETPKLGLQTLVLRP